MSETIDEIFFINAMPEPRRSQVRRRVLALIAEVESSERADWTAVTKLKEARAKKRNGAR